MARNYFATVDSTCRICGRTFRGLAYLGGHIRRTHKMSRKIYYDRFYKKDGEGVCLRCGKDTGFEKLSLGYNRYCSRQCANSDIRTIEGRRKTVQERYGVDHVMRVEGIKKKCFATTKKNLGVEHPSQSPLVVERQKKTMALRYGAWFTQTEEYRRKSRKTSQQRYGVDSPNKADEIKRKQQSTLIKHYGLHPWRNPILINKRRETCFIRYGCENYAQTEEGKRKREETCLSRYGARNHMQNFEILMKCMAHQGRKIKINGKTYDSLWEYKYESYLQDKGIAYEYHPKLFFSYIYKDNNHRYFPDFIIHLDDGSTKIIEIKGDHLAKEMIKPNTKQRARWECMKKNNVIVLFGQDLVDLGIEDIRPDNSMKTKNAIALLKKEV